MSAVKRGLGRGLASLIPDDALDSASPNERASLRHVPLDEIRANPHQPREVFDNVELQSLADSIRAHGVLQPLVLRREEGHYILVAGERRLRAAALAGLREVPAVVRDVDEPAHQLELALVENLQRTDLDPIEAARGYQKLIDAWGYTQDEVAKRVGKERPTVANALRLLKLPEPALQALRDDRISAGHARALLPLGDAESIKKVVGKIEANDLSVRDTEKLVANMTAMTGDPGADPRGQRYEYVMRQLTNVLKTNVTIRGRKDGSGAIVIDYTDADDLERLIAVIRGDY
jgi:ParB family chromosome partitioning protein